MLGIKVPRERAEGCYPPRRFYALAWIDYMDELYVYYPMGLSKLFALVRKVRFWFHRRLRPCEYDNELRKMYWIGRQYGEKHGNIAGIDWAVRVLVATCPDYCSKRMTIPALIRKIEKEFPC